MGPHPPGFLNSIIHIFPTGDPSFIIQFLLYFTPQANLSLSTTCCANTLIYEQTVVYKCLRGSIYFFLHCPSLSRQGTEFCRPPQPGQHSQHPVQPDEQSPATDRPGSWFIGGELLHTLDWRIQSYFTNFFNRDYTDATGAKPYSNIIARPLLLTFGFNFITGKKYTFRTHHRTTQ
jgi:hypothetical protein